ncbi:glycosyltransferase family 2 protein [Sediminibacillus halophilus]|uniref:Glycosyltransferase involved in cell wall bisynthesis n=1 Tax=Sediminibacillus halophilus TaxID=482461 RepID=A0A1G9N534_9BACI|nr:glycosyltransferase family 2 protein [Sediminibacillus halophilus]SDL81503.1 Glycosyltransferase involved in cell wall bisynthesis [Sediminibacillus halophilus]
MNDAYYSFLIPSYNESDNIQLIHEALKEELGKINCNYEILFVDDGSEDDTFKKIHQLAKDHPSVKYVSFTRNFGKEAALLAGLRHARGDAVIIMDADLQHPTYLIGNLIEGFEEGFDQVVAKRNRDGDSRMRSFLSKIYYKWIDQVVDVKLKDGEGDFRLLSRKAVEAVLELSEGNRFSKGLFSWIGFDQKTVYYRNHIRGNGDSKWSYKKLINYGIEGIVSFNQKPLRVCLYGGLIIMFLALLYIFVMLVEIIRTGIDVPGYFSIISSVLFLGGVQLVSLGIIGEYVGRIYAETKRRPHYLIRDSNMDRDL